MEQHAHSSRPMRRVIIVVLALVILTGSLLLMRTSLALNSASAHGCTSVKCTPTPGTTSLNLTPMPTPGTTSCPPEGPQCTGLDPRVQNCPDPHAYGIASQDILDKNGKIVGRIDERYSPTCKSWWARAFVYTGKGAQFYTAAPILISGNGQVPGAFHLLVRAGYTEVYTDMLWAHAYPPEQFTIRVWIQYADGSLVSQDLPANPVTQ